MKANREYIEMMTSALSEHTGVQLVEGKSWAASVDGKKLYFRMDDLKNLPFGITRGFLLHEIGHLKYTTSNAPSPLTIKHGQLMHKIYNSFEDMRIENMLEESYGYFAKYALQELDLWSVKRHLEESHGNYSQMDKIDQFIVMCFFIYYATRIGWVENMLGYHASHCWNDQYRSANYIFDEEVVKRFNERMSDIFSAIFECHYAGSTNKMNEIVDKKIYPIIQDWFPKEDKQEQEQKKQGKSDKKDDSQKKDQQQDGGQPQPGKPEKPDEKEEGTKMVKLPKGNSAGQTNDEDDVARVQRPTEAEARKLLAPLSYTLSQRLKDILNEQSATKWTGAYKRGKLLSKNAYKVGIKDEVRMFSKQNNPDSPSYSIHIALDKSGSMNGPRATYAFFGAALLKDVCVRLGFDINLYSYDRFPNEMRSLDEYTDIDGGTNDEAVIDMITKKVNPNKDNLVFIVTDGETCRSDKFKVLVQKLLRKNTTLFGVGIGDENVEREIKENYPNGVYVKNVQDLPKKLIGIMRTVIHR